MNPPAKFNFLIRCVSYALLIFLGFMNVAVGQGTECEAGTYIGKVGNVPMSMVLDRVPDTKSEERRVGSLYYRTNMVDMVLMQEVGQSDWLELDDQNKTSGHITLQCEGKQLRGLWWSVDRTRRLVINGEISASENYNQRRFKALKLSNLAKSKTSSGVLHEAFTIAGPKMAGESGDVISGFRFLGSDAGIAKINQQLWQEVLNMTDSAMACELQIRQRFGHLPPALSRSQKLIDVIGAYAVVHVSEAHECGWGMGFGEEYRTYYLPAGRQLETSLWFKKSQDKTIRDDAQTTALGRLLLKTLRAKNLEDECVAYNEFSINQVYPSANGLIFFGSVPTAAKFCGLSVEITYAQLAPFLSDDGKKAAHVIQKASASRLGLIVKP